MKKNSEKSRVLFFSIFSIFIFFTVPCISFAEDDVPAYQNKTGQITENPYDLIEQARILKSMKRFNEALKLLKHVLELAPPEKVLEIKIELATTLSWMNRYQEAITIFSEILNKDHENMDARYGLARTYSWAGMYDNAINEYKLILEKRPDDTEAMLGVSRVLAWQGHFDGAIDGYRSILENHPDNIEARSGLANVMYWSGDIKGSLEETRFILALRPDNRDALKLERRLREEKGPLTSFTFMLSSDSDSNLLKIYKTQGYANVRSYIKPDIDYSIFEASRKDDTGNANILTIRNSMPVSKKVFITPRFVLVNINSDINDATYVAGGISTRWAFTKKGSAFLSYGFSPLVDTVQLMRNDISVQEYSTSVLYNTGDITVSAGTSYGKYSDNNSRYDLTSNIAWVVYDEPRTILGYLLDYRDFEKRLYNGYFSPDDFISMRLYLTLTGDIYMNKLEYDATGSIGLQSFESKTENTSSFHVKLIGHLNRNLSMDGGYKWSRSSLETPSGYRFEEYRFGFTYVF